MRRSKPHEPEREIVVLGFDTETHAGPPISLQFHSYDVPRMSRIYQVDADSATARFFAHLERYCATDTHYRMYGHYLEFDLLSALWHVRQKLVSEGGAFEFKYRRWRIVGCYGRPTFARITSPSGHLIEVIDSSLWFRGSLDSAAAQYCPDLRKLERPKHLGEHWFSIKDSAFAEYAMRDAEIAARLGRLVEDFHIQQGLRPSLSLASQAAQIFRSRYIEDPIQQCPTEYIEPALAAYHGGKNNIIPGASPAWHVGAAMYDLSSAYPYAMSQLPAFTDQDGYSEVRLPQGIAPGHVPTPGIYCVTGKLAPCKWPIFFTHDFKPLRDCKVQDLWVHGYELNEALLSGEFKPSAAIKGLYYKDDGAESATAKFSRDFYKLKSTATNPIDRYMYKILLNSISGKFIQTREEPMLQEDGTVKQERVAGGLFHPFIAGAITAHTRALMHRIEHAYAAVHTATDGIIATERKRPPDLGLPGNGLGSLNKEMAGNIVLLRTKLYIGYARGERDDAGVTSRIFDGWKIQKYALHGFQGTVGELEEMIASGRRWYIAPHRIGLKEAVKHDTVPNNFVKRTMKLQVGPVHA